MENQDQTPQPAQVRSEALGSETQVARCRCCKRNDVPVDDMAIFSWKPMFQMFTGICKACFSDEAKMEAYQADIELGPAQSQNNSTVRTPLAPEN